MNDARVVIDDLIAQCGPYGEKEAWGRLQAAIIKLIDRHLKSAQVPWTVSKAIENGLLHLVSKTSMRKEEKEEEAKVRKRAGLALQAVLDVLLPLCREGNAETWEIFSSGVFLPLAKRWVIQRFGTYGRNNLDDLCMAAFVKIYNIRTLELYKRAEGPFVGWLFTVIENAAIDWIRLQLRIGLREPQVDDLELLKEIISMRSTSQSLVDHPIRERMIGCVREELQKLPEEEINRRNQTGVRLSAVQVRQAYIRCLKREVHSDIAGYLTITNLEIHRLLKRIDDRLHDALENLGKDKFSEWLYSAPDQDGGNGEGLGTDDSAQSASDGPLENTLWDVEEYLKKRLQERRCKRAEARANEVLEELELPEPWPAILDDIDFKDLFDRDTRMKAADKFGIPYGYFCKQYDVIRKQVYEALRRDYPELEDNLADLR